MGLFEDENLNKIVAKSLNKKEVTEEDLEKQGLFQLITIKKNELSQPLSQNDFNKLCKAKSISFREIDFKNLELEGKTDFSALEFKDCNLLECKIKSITTKSLILKDCELENKENELLKNIKVLNSLELKGVDLNEEILKEIGNYKEIKNLIIDDKISKNIILPQLENLQFLKLKNVEDFKSISNNENITNLNIQNDIAIKPQNMQILEEYKKLERVNIKNIKNIHKHIKAYETITSLNFENCGIETIDDFARFNKLNFLKIDENNLKEEELESIIKFKQEKNLNSISFMECAAYEKARNTIFTSENKEIEEKTRKILKIYGKNPLNLYDIIENSNVKLQTIEDIEVLKQLGIFEFYKNDSVLDIKSLENLSQEDLEYINNNVKKIKIETFRGINEDVLNKLSNCKYIVKGDELSDDYSGKLYYTKEDMKEILEYIEVISSNIPKNSDELTKFLSIYTDMADYVYYDKSGCHSKEEFIEGNDKRTRSLKGVLVDGKAVCAGYSLALKYLLDYNGIQAIKCGGYAHEDSNLGHAWNQVKIDGKTYNTDLTWDCKNHRRKEELKYCLRNDEIFYKNHTPDKLVKIEKCEEDFDRDKIHKALENIKRNKYKTNNKQEPKTMFNITDFKEWALNTGNVIKTEEILQALNEVGKDSINRKKDSKTLDER